MGKCFCYNWVADDLSLDEASVRLLIDVCDYQHDGVCEHPMFGITEIASANNSKRVKLLVNRDGCITFSGPRELVIILDLSHTIINSNLSKIVGLPSSLPMAVRTSPKGSHGEPKIGSGFVLTCYDLVTRKYRNLNDVCADFYRKHKRKQYLKIFQTASPRNYSGITKSKILIPKLLKLFTEICNAGYPNSTHDIRYLTRKVISLTKRKKLLLKQDPTRSSPDSIGRIQLLTTIILPILSDLFIISLDNRTGNCSYITRNHLITRRNDSEKGSGVQPTVGSTLYSKKKVYKIKRNGSNRFLAERVVWSLNDMKLPATVVGYDTNMTIKEFSKFLLQIFNNRICKKGGQSKSGDHPRKSVKTIVASRLQYIPRNGTAIVTDLVRCFDFVSKRAILELKKYYDQNKTVRLCSVVVKSCTGSEISWRQHYVSNLNDLIKIYLGKSDCIEVSTISVREFKIHSLIDIAYKLLVFCDSRDCIVQGDPLSTLICNIHHHEHDLVFAEFLKAKKLNFQFSRYIDDLCIVIDSNDVSPDFIDSLIRVIKKIYNTPVQKYKSNVIRLIGKKTHHRNNSIHSDRSCLNKFFNSHY